MQIHVARGGQTLGIFSPAEVRSRIASGEFQLSDLAWTEGQAEWAALSTFPDLMPPPAAPTAPPPFPPVSRPSVPPPTFSPSTASAGAVPSHPEPFQTKTSGTAIASLIFGILGITILPFLASIPAVICGHVAHSGIKRHGQRLKGSGMATAGLITGYLGLTLIVILPILAGIALPVFGAVQLKGKQTKSLSQAKQIATACRLYAVDNGGAFPKKLEDLIPDYLEDSKALVCPILGDSEPVGYEYYGSGGKDTDPPSNILLVGKAVGKKKERIVVRFDTSGAVTKDMPELPAHTAPPR